MERLNIYVTDTIKYRLASEKLVGKGCNSCNNGACRVPSYEKENVCECAGWTNSNMQKEAVILVNYDVIKLQNIPDLDGEVLLQAELPSKKIDSIKSGCKTKKLF